MGKLTHVEVEELLGAYALDALEPDEQAVVEDHLRDCPRCRAEVAAHRETAALLAHAGAEAPTGLWDRIIGQLEEQPPEFDAARILPFAPPARPARRGVPTRVFAAVLSAAAVVVALLSVQVVRQDERIDELAASLQERGLKGVALAAVLEESARKVQLRSDDGRLAAEAVVLGNGDGYLLRHNLPDLPDERTYQLWALAGATTVSVGVLGPDPDVVAFRAPAGLTALALTSEVAGGVVATQNRPLVSGFVGRI